MASSAIAAIRSARSLIGTSGRPNKVTRAYAKKHGNAFLDAPWCEMGTTWEAHDSGNADVMLPRGDRAYTVYGAQDGQFVGTYYIGTTKNIIKYCEPGAKVYFDWDGRNVLGDVDHVGLCEENLNDGRVQTIECNTGDACKRRVRSARVIACFWMPHYAAAPPKPKPAKLAAPAGYPILKLHSKGPRVEMLQDCLLKVGEKLPKYGSDGDFGTETSAALGSFQRKHGIKIDHEYGPVSAKYLKAALAKK